MTDNGRRYYLSPGVISKTKPDPSEYEREQRRKRALGIPQELRWSIDSSIAERVGVMRRVQSD